MNVDKYMEIMIEWAKNALLKHNTGRKWLECSPPDSYSESEYKIRVFVLEGSPPRGIVVANYGVRKVKAFDSDMYQIKFGEKSIEELEDYEEAEKLESLLNKRKKKDEDYIKLMLAIK
jgi:hypothetical protein